MRIHSIGVLSFALLACDSTADGPTELRSPIATPPASARSGQVGSAFFNGSIEGGGSMRFDGPSALTLRLSGGRQLATRVCPATIICGGTWGGSGGRFVAIVTFDDRLNGKSAGFEFGIGWGDADQFEVAILDDLDAWWAFMEAQTGSTPEVIDNIRAYIATSDNVIRGTVHHTP